LGSHPVAVVQYTFTHKQQHKTNNIQNNTKIWKSVGRAPSLRVLPCYLPYSWGKSTEKPVFTEYEGLQSLFFGKLYWFVMLDILIVMFNLKTEIQSYGSIQSSWKTITLLSLLNVLHYSIFIVIPCNRPGYMNY
jgi:hypothetical protein